VIRVTSNLTSTSHPPQPATVHKGHTVDGLNIRRSPVEVGSLSVYPLIYEDLYIPGGAGFQPATVVKLDSVDGKNIFETFNLKPLQKSR